MTGTEVIIVEFTCFYEFSFPLAFLTPIIQAVKPWNVIPSFLFALVLFHLAVHNAITCLKNISQVLCKATGLFFNQLDVNSQRKRPTLSWVTETSNALQLCWYMMMNFTTFFNKQCHIMYLCMKNSWLLWLHVTVGQTIHPWSLLFLRT